MADVLMGVVIGYVIGVWEPIAHDLFMRKYFPDRVERRRK